MRPRQRDSGLLLNIRVTPGGSRDAVTGVWTGKDGRRYLAVKVAAPPVDGAANEAVRRLVACEARLPRRAVTLVAGEHAREKTVSLTGDRDAILAWLHSVGMIE